MGRGQLSDFLLLPCPRGNSFSRRTDNLVQIIYIADGRGLGTVYTYMSTLSHTFPVEGRLKVNSSKLEGKNGRASLLAVLIAVKPQHSYLIKLYYNGDQPKHMALSSIRLFFLSWSWPLPLSCLFSLLFYTTGNRGK